MVFKNMGVYEPEDEDLNGHNENPDDLDDLSEHEADEEIASQSDYESTDDFKYLGG